MDLFWKTIGIAFVASILALSLEKQGKDFSLLLALTASGAITISALHYLAPVMDFLSRLASLGNLNSTVLLSLMKILGVGMAGEISASVCTDSGNSTIAKGLRLLTNAAILSLSVPIFSSMIDLMQYILGDL